MKSMDLLETIGSIRDKYILEAHSQNIVQKKRIPSKRLFLIAAIIALMLLLVGCVAYILGLKDMYVGEYTHDAGFAGTQNSDMISLQGYAGSPEYLAAKEWNEYLLSYDEDKSIIGEISNNPTNLDSKYTEYQVYTQEMCDKLEEISQKYDLKLHSVLNTIDQAELDYRVGGEFTSDNLSRGWAYIYEDGTFQFDGDVYLNNTQVLFQLRRSVKGTLDEVVLTIGNIEHYQESQYQTASGEPVMLAVGPTKGLIIADFENCFITVNVLGSYGIDITEEHLKYIADSIDYSVLKNVITPDMRGDSVDTANKPAEETNADSQNSVAGGDDRRISAYKAVLSNGMQYHQFPEARDLGYDGSDMAQNKFAILDIDGDGNDELVFMYTTTYNAGMAVMIYDFDSTTGMVREEFFQYPSVNFYDNGIIKANASHNHGNGGEFWPYTLYSYNSETDIYEQIASVDAWDKTITEEDNQGNRFPDSIDQDGDGIVYYIIPYAQSEDVQPVDNAQYDEWCQSYIGNAVEVQIPYQKLTEQNIAAIIPAAGEHPPVSQPQNSDDWVQAKSKFEAILSGKDGFLNRDQAEGMTISQFCENFGAMAEVDFRITQHALSDLDHDGTPELILWENINGVDDCGFLVIRYDGKGGAVGYEFSYRQLIDLKYDGTFGYSGGVASSGFATLVFNDKGWEYDIFGCVEENESDVSFKWGDGLLSEDEYWNCAQKQSAKETVQWMPYPADSYDLSYDDLS